MTTSSSISPANNKHLHDLIESARPFLREDIESVDKNLPTLLTILRSAGAGECWHRLGTFSDHLYHVYRILKLWKAPDPVCLFGLLHSVYSNSYHNLAIFDPVTDRETVRKHVGGTTESLIHLFCIVPRHTLIHDDLVFQYTDSELREHLQASEHSLKCSSQGSVRNEENWRKKIQDIVPATGIEVKHIRTGETVVLPRRVLAVFLLMTIADFGDQFYGYQDELYDNTDGRLEFTGNTNFDVLWPGNGKPGLWMNLISKKPGLCIEKNPFVGEPHVLLSQFYVSRGRFEEGEIEGEKGLSLLLEWGCPWDKRVSWEGWVAWSRVLLSKAKERSWPNTSWGIISLGLVK